MLNQAVRERIYLLTALDACLLWIAFAASLWLRLLVPQLLMAGASPITLSDHVWAILIAIPLHAFHSSASGQYAHVGSLSTWRLLRGVAKTSLYLTAILGLTIFLFQAKFFSRAVFFLFMGIGFSLVVSARLLARRILRRTDRRSRDVRNILIVGINPEAAAFHRKLESIPDLGFKVVGHLAGPGEERGRVEAPDASGAGLWSGPAVPDEGDRGNAPVLGTLQDLRKVVVERVVDEVVFAVPFSKVLICEPQIAWCEEIGTTVHLKVDFVRTLLSKTYPSDFEGVPMLTLASTPLDPLSLALKRVIDVVVSAISLFLLGPLMATVALLIRCTSRGPVFFRQRRVGLQGRIFTLYKFRSMRDRAEEHKRELAAFNEMSGPVFKMKNDPRVTGIGALLRKFSLDELPQLWNVFVGDLSLVGPRPPTPDEVEQYEWWQRRRLSVKPGVTCLWQVSGRNEIDFEEWMRLDLKYIDSWSLKLDLEILLRTVPAVLSARGSH